MKTLTVNTATAYPVYLGTSLLEEAGALARRSLEAKKIMIVTDSNVFPLYGKKLQDSLMNAGFSVATVSLPAGEQSKTPEVYLHLLDRLSREGLTREDCLFALGGGVIGDLTGFAAATYLRGISYVQCPTTLLSMVDSSIGGKTGIDLPRGKNLCGAFWQPRFVLCDWSLTDTIPRSEYCSGVGEILKYGVLEDPELLSISKDFDKEAVITRCIEIKSQYVSADETDRNIRKKLNLGHTVGHAIEVCSEYTVPHGAAVAVGLAIVTRAATKLQYCDPSVLEAVETACRRFSLPIITYLTAEQLFSVIMQDKKRNSDGIDWIVPYSIGHCGFLTRSLIESRDFLKEGL